MKKILIVLTIAIIGGIGYLIYKTTEEKTATIIPTTTTSITTIQNITEDPKNATYSIGTDSFTLVNGKSEKVIIPGSAASTITQYFGNEVKADFNSDGLIDTAFLLTQSSGGSGTFYYLAVVLGTNTGYKGTNAILLGDRIAPQATGFQNGEIIANYADRKPGEPMTATPSIGVSRYFKISSNKLVEIIK
jgi:uncharacterized protein YxeA